MMPDPIMKLSDIPNQMRQRYGTDAPEAQYVIVEGKRHWLTWIEATTFEDTCDGYQVYISYLEPVKD